MDWKEIKEKYPKCIELLSKGSQSGVWVMKYMSDARLLYDFFDEQEIFIEIQVDAGTNDDHQKYLDFSYRIETYDFRISHGEDFCSRGQAEERAFLEAFVILERRLAEKAW